MPELVGLFASFSILPLIAVLAYCLRMRRNRRLIAEDHQRFSPGARKFHVCLLFQVHSGARIDETARHFVHKILGGGDVRLIYAGQVAFSIDSRQLGPARWDGLLLFELRSRERFNAAYTERFRRARALFHDSYLFGMRRPVSLNARLPLSQLGLLIRRVLRGKLREEPLRDLPELDALPEHDAVRGYLRRLHAVYQIRRDALVVYNLAQRKRPVPPVTADTLGALEYTQSLLARLARLAMGPLHVGRFARIEHNAVFHNVYVMQYPSARYFGRLLRSQYHQTITSHPQLSDGLVIPTVPITSRL